MGNLILNPTQAEAVYSAMCELNNVSGLIRAEFEGGDITVQEHHTSGKVTVVRLAGSPARQEFESYANQSAFAAAYSLLPDRAEAKAADAPEYNQAGHICPETGRIAMTVEEAYAREDSADRVFFSYSVEDAARDLVGWRRIEGIDVGSAVDADGRPTEYTLDYDETTSFIVRGQTIIYMQRTKAERRAAEGSR